MNTMTLIKEGDWLREDDTIEGFEWSGGCEQVTSGIHIWSKPFIHVKETGERVMCTCYIFIVCLDGCYMYMFHKLQLFSLS